MSHSSCDDTCDKNQVQNSPVRETNVPQGNYVVLGDFMRSKRDLFDELEHRRLGRRKACSPVVAINKRPEFHLIKQLATETRSVSQSSYRTPAALRGDEIGQPEVPWVHG